MKGLLGGAGQNGRDWKSAIGSNISLTSKSMIIQDFKLLGNETYSTNAKSIGNYVRTFWNQ